MPKSATRRTDGFDAQSDDFGAMDFRSLKLKPDHEVRPLWITPEGHVFVESFSPMYQAAHNFLVTVAEVI